MFFIYSFILQWQIFYILYIVFGFIYFSYYYFVYEGIFLFFWIIQVLNLDFIFSIEEYCLKFLYLSVYVFISLYFIFFIYRWILEASLRLKKYFYCCLFGFIIEGSFIFLSQNWGVIVYCIFYSVYYFIIFNYFMVIMFFFLFFLAFWISITIFFDMLRYSIK